MNEGGYRMIRGRGFILVMTVLFASACATAGGGEAGTPETGNRPRDNSYTNTAGVHLVQAGTAEEAEAMPHYQEALSTALEGIQADSTNPKLYLLAGQAAVGLENWVQADTMFEKALELYPGYDERITVEREEAWATAYNVGAEALNAGDQERALEYFEGADRLYQDRPEARMALGYLYMQRGNTAQAGEAYADALEILSGPPPEEMDEEQAASWVEDRQVAAFNASQMLAQAGEFGEAADILQGFLSENEDQLDPETELQAQTLLAGFLAQAGREEEAEALYNQILTREDLTSAEYFQVGIGFFNTNDYARAAEAFKEAAELNPYSRDALLNLVQSLYSQALELEEAQEDLSGEQARELDRLYDELLTAAEQVRDFDPLNRNLVSFMLRSLRAKADLAETAGEIEEAENLASRTQELFRRYQQQPYEVSEISVQLTGENEARMTGLLTNLTGTAGDEVELRFSLVDREGNVLDSSTIAVTAPEQNASAQFTTTLSVTGGEFAGWMYEVVN